VVRYRLDDGATDALGKLHAREADHVVIETRRGLARVPLGDVIAAKPVPPAPARKNTRVIPDDAGDTQE
jgi:hypothetical protein